VQNAQLCALLCRWELGSATNTDRRVGAQLLAGLASHLQSVRPTDHRLSQKFYARCNHHKCTDPPHRAPAQTGWDPAIEARHSCPVERKPHPPGLIRRQGGVPRWPRVLLGGAGQRWTVAATATGGGWRVGFGWRFAVVRVRAARPDAGQRPSREHAPFVGLVLQQHFVIHEPPAPVVAAAGAGLVRAPVPGPGEGVSERAGGGAGQVCQETADLGWGEGDQAGCAFGLAAAVTAR